MLLIVLIISVYLVFLIGREIKTVYDHYKHEQNRDKALVRAISNHRGTLQCIELAGKKGLEFSSLEHRIEFSKCFYKYQYKVEPSLNEIEIIKIHEEANMAYTPPYWFYPKSPVPTKCVDKPNNFECK